MHNETQEIQTNYDLIVIGGGIYGAAVLWEAAHRGLRCLLLEKHDFTSQTSANSLKTIHGGIRYLQQLNFSRAYACDKEKVILSKIAPNLITPLNCYLPSNISLSKNPISLLAASQLFNFVSKISPNGSGRNSNVFKTATLSKKSLPQEKYCLYWQDAQVKNSEHLTLSYLSSAQEYAAHCLNYAPVTSVKKDKKGFITEFKKTGEDNARQLHSRFVIDCSNTSQHIDPNILQHQPDIGFVTGINLILDMQIADGLIALTSHDKQLAKKGMLTFSPWQDSTIAGTWYFSHQTIQHKRDMNENIIQVCVQDIYLALTQAGYHHKKEQIRRAVIDCHIGKLPADTSILHPEKSIINKAITRELTQHYFQLIGNKYTTARLNAVNIINRIKQSHKSILRSQSHQLPLSGFAVKAEKNRASHSVLNDVLSQRYGRLASDMLSLLEEPISSDKIWLDKERQISQHEILYFAQQDAVQCLSDILYRRLNINFHRAYEKQIIEKIAHLVGSIKKWSDEHTHQEIKTIATIEKSKSAFQTHLGEPS